MTPEAPREHGGLVALVGPPLGQTLVAGGIDPAVPGASLGPFAALVAVVQTPGVRASSAARRSSPLGWATAATATEPAVGGARC